MSLAERRHSAPARRRPVGRTAVLVLLTWAVAAMVALSAAARTSVGPVVLILSSRHGVHLGDLAALAAVGAAAAVVTWAIILPHHRR